MAFNGIVGVSNIGSFLLQAVTFGQCTINNYSKIEVRLLDASRQLKEATMEIKKYTNYLTDDEFEKTMRQCEDAMQLVINGLKEDAARKSFIVEAKKYRETKEEAQKKVILSVEVMAAVDASHSSSVSTRAKRRTEKQVEEAANRLRLQRIDEVERQANSAQASLTHGLKQVLPPLSPSPSRLGNEPNSPFRDPSASNLNLIGGDAGDISL
ncbi:hypothetical protein C0995_008514 [Termitomyces sp. Mi166|nr:hypothetical protein C0995_008514 [Termitomyces sp. Mi166\